MVCRLMVVASLLVAATAYAQAPGEVAPAAPPPAAPPCVSGGYHESVMANRWAVGLGIGSLSVAPKDQPDAKQSFGVGEIALRFRATLHLELELALGGGREQLPNNQQGDLEAHTGVLGLRYRFAPESKWNWWLMGGIGSLSVVPHGANNDAQNAAQRPLGEFGIGLERRFHHFALDAELRVVGVGQNKQDQAQPVMATPTAMTTTPPPSTTPPPAQGESGGQFTIGASYYF